MSAQRRLCTQMPSRSCSLLPCSAPLKHNSAFGRHALHRRPSYSCRQSRRHRGTCIEAKKKGQQKASKRFGNQTFELKTPDAEAGESGLTDYLRMGRALGESPAEVEKTLKARGVAVNWDTTAQNYMQQWQDEETSEYAAAAGIMARLAQQAAPQSRANAKLQKNKQKAGANDTVIEFAQREMTARNVSKRFKPLTVLKAKGKAAPEVTLAQRPTRGASSGSASGEDGDGVMLLSRPRPASEDEARWLQQAQQGDFDIDDDGDNDAFLSSADDGPPALSYEDFEALLNAPKAPPKAKQSPPSKPAVTPSLQLNRPQSSASKGQRSKASSSSTAATSSSAFVKQDAPVLSARPGVYWQKKPSVPEATPAAPSQGPPPKLAGRPAKPTPAPSQVEAQKQMLQEEEDQQLSAAGATPLEPQPTLVGRPAQPAAPPPPPAQVEEHQPNPTEEEHHEKVEPLAAAAPPQDPQPMPAQPPAKPSAIPAQREKKQQSQERYSRPQLSAAAAPPQDPPPMLVGRPAKPTSPPARVPQEVTHQQQMLKEQEEIRERLLSVDSTQESSEDAQRDAPALDVPNQEPQSFAKGPARLRSDGAKTGKAQDELPKLSRPQLLLQAEEKQQLHVSRPAPPLPALARPAPPSPATAAEADIDSRVAAAVSKIQERAKSRRLRQVKTSAADKAAAEQAAQPSLQLISPPRRRDKPSVADLTNPVSWDLMDFEKFVAENPNETEHKRRDYFYRLSLQQKAQQEGPQLPPPTLAGRPARPLPARIPVQKSLSVAEWQQEAVLQYAQYAMEGKRRLTVLVTGANGGGIMVRSRNLRGFIPAKMLSQESYTKVLAREAELLQEKGMSVDAPEEEVRKVRVEALRCLTKTILTATIVNLVPGRRIILSERTPRDLSDNPSQQQLDAGHLAVLKDNMGQVVEGVVVDVRPFGCFMEFDVEAEGGNKHKVYGMVHVSEVSWDYCEDARLRVKTGQDVEAILMGVDSASGKVWLSMRQVLPDPLQETLDALLAQGPPSDPSEDGNATEGSTEHPGGLSYPEDEASMAFQEVLEVAEALVLLPGVDSVMPGRQLFTRAAARDLQVYMSSVPLADFAASITAEEQALDSSSSSDEEDLNEDTDVDAVSASAASPPSTLEAEDAVTGELQERQAVQSSGDATEEQQPLKMTDAGDGTPHEDVTDGEQLTSEAADIASFDGADVLGASTLVVRKGQQLQELVVSGSITQGELRDEIEKIVSFLLSPEDLM